MSTTPRRGTSRNHHSTGLDERSVGAWRRDWDVMMSAYLPDEAPPSILDIIGRTRSRSRFRLLDLDGGPGTVSERVLRQWPTSEVTLLEVDPVMLALPSAALPSAAVVVDTDLATPAWTATIGGDLRRLPGRLGGPCHGHVAALPHRPVGYRGPTSYRLTL